MEPQVNIKLLNQYLLATGQLDSIWDNLISQYMLNLDETQVPYLPTISQLLVGIIAVSRYYENYGVTLTQTNSSILVSVCSAQEEVLSLVFDDNNVSINYPENINTLQMPLDTHTANNELIPSLVAALTDSNCDVDTLFEALGYLEEVYNLISNSRVLDVESILKELANDLSEKLESLNSIVRVYTNGHDENITSGKDDYPVNGDDDYSDEIHSPVPVVNRSGAPSINYDNAVEFVEMFSQYVDTVNAQTGRKFSTTAEGQFKYTVSFEDENETALWTIDKLQDVGMVMYGLKPISSDIIDPLNLDYGNLREFTSSVRDNIGNITYASKHGLTIPAFNTLNQFLQTVVTLMENSTDLKDIHMPSEEKKDSGEQSQTTRVMKLARETYKQVSNLFCSNPRVNIYVRLGYVNVVKQSQTPFNDVDGDTLEADNFIELTAISYASSIINNSKQHTDEHAANFVETFINSLIAINWDRDVLVTMTPAALYNRANWVVGYEINKVISTIADKASKEFVFDLTFDEDINSLIIPAGNMVNDIRKFLNQTGRLFNLPSQSVIFANRSDKGVDTTYRYIQLDGARGDTTKLVVYIETTADKIRIIPVYLDTELKRVDSLNVFSSIRETEWPGILTYLAQTLSI